MGHFPKERWSYCEAALAHAREHGELPLCPMCGQWTPWCLRRQIEVQKSYKLKTGERWITVHPNGKDEKGQPLLIKEHSDGTASVIAGAGGRLNGLRLRKTKDKAEYQNLIKAKREQIKAKQAAEQAAEKASEKEMGKEERAAHSRGQVDIEALKELSPGSFAGVPKAEQAQLAGALSAAVGTLRTAAENRVINQSAAKDNAKVKRLAAIVGGKHYADGQKSPGVIFAHNRESLKQIEAQLRSEGHRVAVLHGGHSGSDKERIRNAFNPPTGEGRQHDVLVMSDAGATGMNLQNAKWLINYDLPDTDWLKQQREGRIDRHGQAHNEIEYQDLITDTEHDQVKAARIQRKAELGAIFETAAESVDDRGILSYWQGVAQENYDSGERAA